MTGRMNILRNWWRSLRPNTPRPVQPHDALRTIASEYFPLVDIHVEPARGGTLHAVIYINGRARHIVTATDTRTIERDIRNLHLRTQWERHRDRALEPSQNRDPRPLPLRNT